jgi:predicted amidohydrolase YtcJ
VSGRLFRDVEFAPGRRGDVRVAGGRIVEVGHGLELGGEQQIAGRGGALLPGLADHHLHLLATAADGPLRCGPPSVTTPVDLAAALAAAPADAQGWVRGTGYDEHVAGSLDRWALDRLHRARPVRVQHRGGSLWMLNSAGLAAIGAAAADHDGIERGADGEPTGRLWRADAWLRSRLPPPAPPDLAQLGRRLAAYGITAVTDAGPDLDPAAVAVLSQACRTGALAQRAMLLGVPGQAEGSPPRLSSGPYKIIVADHQLPSFEDLTAQIARQHAAGRPVALHVVTREALVLTLAALAEAGPLPGDRLEHLSVAPGELVEEIRRMGLRVVTQPGFLADRGDRYLDEVDPRDQQDLYRYGSLLQAGVPTAPSSDAPYGPLDPWAVLRAARDRRAPDGRVLGARERVAVATALAGYLSDQRDPGGPPRSVVAGATADLVLLSAGWHAVLEDPQADLVRLTMIDGVVVHGADG